MRVAIVSNYPPPGAKHASGVGGAIASYSCNLVSSLPKDDLLAYEVYANYSKSIPANKCDQNGAVVYRCWRKGPGALFSIVQQVLKHKPDLVHIQYDFFLYGGKVTALLFPLMLLALRVTGTPVVVTMHGVVSTASLSQDIVKRSGTKLPLFLVRVAFFVLTRLILLLSNRVIVHDEHFRELLEVEYCAKSSHITVIPIGVEDRADTVEIEEAKQALGLACRKTLLFFGYLSGYKGIELLLDAFGIVSREDPQLALNIVGQDTPGHFVGNRAQGQRYSDMLKEKARDISPHITFYGFVPEEDLGIHFCAADVVLFPYLLQVGGSAALSMCIGYERPFLISDALASTESHPDLVFKRSPEDLACKIEEFFSSTTLREVATAYVKGLKRGNLWGEAGGTTRAIYEQFGLKNRQR